MRPFEDHEVQFIRDNWDTMSNQEIGEKIDRSPDVVKAKARMMGLCRRGVGTMVRMQEDEEYMKAHRASIMSEAERRYTDVNHRKTRKHRA